MKTILRIIVVLLVASIVAAGFYVAVNNSSTTSSDENGQPLAMAHVDGQNIQPMDRPEGGDHEGGSIAQGLSGLLVTLAKLAGITLLVLLLEGGLRKLSSLKANYSHP